VQINSVPGEGTTVTLYLPRLLAAPGEAAHPRAAPAPAPVGPARGETVLVVEDDAAVRASTLEMLRELGYQVLEAADGRAALRLLEAAPEVALLFTDVGLPGGLNGRQLAHKAGRRRAGLKVLFTTGYARDAIVHQGRLEAGVELIVKPFTIAALGAKIQHLLARTVSTDA
jgi:CheY-like chemotaxis protein